MVHWGDTHKSEVKPMNALISFVLLLVSWFGLAGSVLANLEAKDLQPLVASQWQGTLTYLDYSANKKVSILSNLTVTQSTEDKQSWIFSYQYPEEPKANEIEIVKVSSDGKMIDKETIIEKTSLGDNTLKIVTEESGMDNDKRATLRHTYLLSATNFSIKKEVRYEGTQEFFERNEYRWQKQSI
jgi:hypothetical protein